MDELGYRFVDHTGDFALEVDATTPTQAVEGTARALLHLLTDDPACVVEARSRPITLDAIDGPSLLVELGNELLYLFEAEGFLWARLVVNEDSSDLSEGVLVGELRGEPFDPERHPIARPFKAVTHHGARLDTDDEGTHARVIIDL